MKKNTRCNLSLVIIVGVALLFTTIIDKPYAVMGFISMIICMQYAMAVMCGE